MEKKEYEKYENIKELGTGNFGQVRLVKCVDTQKLYALKSVSLGRLSQKEKDGALNEVRLLASFDIPSVIKYEGSFYN
jgi:NIMA (never in mitosis gene a)-related kinase